MSALLAEQIRSRAAQAQDAITQAARRAGRNPDDIRLVTVTKTHPPETVLAAMQAGLTLFGENYAEEAVAKMQALPAGAEWHMIGHVQSRKAELVAANFSVLHSLDSLKLAGRLNRFAAEQGRVLPVLLEVNVGGEETKFGYPASTPAQVEALAGEVEQILQFSALKICGLMTMPPFFDDGEPARPYFKALRTLRDVLARRFPALTWDELSMGTSADYAVAVEEGATLVRVGTAILGPRPARGEPA